jgi:hypothetical protein
MTAAGHQIRTKRRRWLLPLIYPVRSRCAPSNVQSFASGFFITHAKAEWNFEPLRESNAQDILIAFDESDRIALVKAGTDGSFAHPFTCEPL